MPPLPSADPHLHRHATLDSTNSEAFRLAETGAPHGTIVLADHQTAGRGQPGRTWWMTPGQGILVSMLLRRLPPGVEFTDLTRRVGWELATLFREGAGLDVEIKPPNDLLIGGRKFCGVLCEARWRDDAMLCAVVGVGVDVNVTEFPPELQATATSLTLALGHELDREEWIGRVIERLRRLAG